MTGRRYAIAWAVLIAAVLGVIAIGWFGARRGYDRHEERRATEAAASLTFDAAVGVAVPVVAAARRAGSPLAGAVAAGGVHPVACAETPFSVSGVVARLARPGGPAGGARAST